jgi:alanine dehydrogenase
MIWSSGNLIARLRETINHPIQLPDYPITKFTIYAVTEAPLWITESDVVSLIDMGDAIRALEAGLRAEARGAAANMTKTHVEWIGEDGGHSTLHAIGAAFPEAAFAGTKTWAHAAGGATPLLILFDARTGALRAVIEAFGLGQLRTGAASGVATAALAAPDARQLAIIGTGRQALSQIAAVAAVRPLERVRVHGRDSARRAQCAARVRDELGLEAVEAESVGDAVDGAPIVTTATRARAPFLTASMVARGAHINAIGAITPGGAEVAPDVVARCGTVATDSVAQAQKLSSELIGSFGTSPHGWTRVQSLAALVASGRGRAAGDDLTLFKSLGTGISDLSLGLEIYRRAVTAGVGRAFDQPRKVAPRLRAGIGKI